MYETLSWELMTAIFSSLAISSLGQQQWWEQAEHQYGKEAIAVSNKKQNCSWNLKVILKVMQLHLLLHISELVL